MYGSSDVPEPDTIVDHIREIEGLIPNVFLEELLPNPHVEPPII